MDSTLRPTLPADGFDWLRFHFLCEILFNLLSLGLSCLAIYLAIYRAPKAMRDFRVVIILSCSSDLVMSAISVAVMQLVDIRGNDLYMVHSGVFLHSSAAASIALTSVFLFGMYLLLNSVCMQFICRHSILCRTTPFSPKQLCVIYLALNVPTAILASLSFAVLEECDSKVLAENRIYAANTPTCLVNHTIKLKNAWHPMCSMIVVGATYGIVLRLGRSIYRTLKEVAGQMSRSTMAAQRQLSRIMIFQAIYPFCALSAPIVMVCVSSLAGIRNDLMGVTLICLGSALPLMNALTVILCVPTFRRTLFGGLQSKVTNTLRSSVGSGGTAAQMPIIWRNVAK